MKPDLSLILPTGNGSPILVCVVEPLVTIYLRATIPWSGIPKLRTDYLFSSFHRLYNNNGLLTHSRYPCPSFCFANRGITMYRL